MKLRENSQEVLQDFAPKSPSYDALMIVITEQLGTLDKQQDIINKKVSRHR